MLFALSAEHCLFAVTGFVALFFSYQIRTHSDEISGLCFERHTLSFFSPLVAFLVSFDSSLLIGNRSRGGITETECCSVWYQGGNS